MTDFPMLGNISSKVWKLFLLFFQTLEIDPLGSSGLISALSTNIKV
jgi:hypothetical protein